jgi:trehalose-phosphatase
VRTTHGKEVVELSVVDTDKGRALDRLREETGADAVVFAGDDVTDETAFARLTPTDVGIKVGPGDTAARFRVESTTSVATVLAALAEARSAQVTF